MADRLYSTSLNDALCLELGLVDNGTSRGSRELTQAGMLYTRQEISDQLNTSDSTTTTTVIQRVECNNNRTLDITVNALVIVHVCNRLFGRRSMHTKRVQEGIQHRGMNSLRFLTCSSCSSMIGSIYIIKARDSYASIIVTNYLVVGIAQLGERQSEVLQVLGSIPSRDKLFIYASKKHKRGLK